MEIDGARLGVDIKKHQTEQQNKQELEGTRLGIDIAKSKAQMARPPKGGTNQ
jgi:hypothetical protein